jgi:release factor glutamine methyltransferase
VIAAALAEATAKLAAAGVESPRVDAEWIAAHVLGVPRSRIATATMTPTQAESFATLIDRRAERIPLQHLIGAHFYGIDLDVGPGVFIPRPETELLVEWGLARLLTADPIVVDLCTGSGAIAIAVATERPDAAVYAVDFSEAALACVARNAGNLDIRTRLADIRKGEGLDDIAGRVDLVLCNPPYVPEATRVPAEVASHDPPAAVFAGPDGLALMPAVVTTATRVLKPGGYVGIEHDDSHGEVVPQLLIAAGFESVSDHRDLAGRPRFATARRA